MTKENPFGLAPFDPAQYLNDEQSIAEFLNASIEMNDPAVLLNAISTVARARSMSQLAEASGLGRESLYKALKPGAQPRYDTVMRVINALGMELVFRPPRNHAAKPAETVARAGAVAAKTTRPAVVTASKQVLGQARSGTASKARATATSELRAPATKVRAGQAKP